MSFVESRKFSRKPALLRLEFFATSNWVRLFQLFRLGWCELFDFVSFICFVYLTDSRMFSSTFYLNIARQISEWNTIERIVGQIRYTKTRLEYVYSPIYSLLLVWIYQLGCILGFETSYYISFIFIIIAVVRYKFLFRMHLKTTIIFVHGNRRI